MYIVQLITADTACPVLITEDIVRAVEFAQSIDLDGLSAQDIRIFAAAQDLPDFDAERAFFSRVQRRLTSSVGGPFIGPVVWHDLWHEPTYQEYYDKAASV